MYGSSNAGSRWDSTTPRRPTWLIGCGGCLIAFIILSVAGVLSFPFLTGFVNQQVSQQLTGLQQTARSITPISRLTVPALQVSPTFRPTAETSGLEFEVAITDEQANAYLANQSNPNVRNLQLTFRPNQAEASFDALGMPSHASAGVQVDEGTIHLTNVTVDGPLKDALDTASITALLEERINAQIQASGMQIRAVRIEQGRMIITVRR